MILIYRNYEKKEDKVELLVYSRIYRDAVVDLLDYKNGIFKRPAGKEMRVFEHSFKVVNGHVLLDGFEKKLLDLIVSNNEHQYIIMVFPNEVVYTFTRGNVKIQNGKFSFHAFNYPSGPLRPVSSLMGFYYDPAFLEVPQVKFSNNEVHLRPQKFTLDTFPNTIIFDKIDDYIAVPIIHTKNGPREIPLKPGFLSSPVSERVGTYFATTLTIVENSILREMIPNWLKVIPLMETPNEYAIVYYVTPRSWRSRVGEKVFARHFDWVAFTDGKDPYGFGGTHYTTSSGDVYFSPELPTGQQPLYLRIFNDKAIAYGIVTPEGVYTLRLPVQRLFEETPASIFENGVEVLAMHFYFPIQIPFSKSAMTYGTFSSFSITIDDVKLPKLPNTLSPTSVKDYFEKGLSITRDKYDVVLNFGLSAV